ncbi:Quinate dehydrogenase [Lasiodiplodia theobromae]|uniref:Quinate dehydrogenase n=1 Tax=Lasiodiplodia theobromae TaxID=45133 RepID=A0A5N5DDM6_9PEZI|nr:Quinate dehydrogenase [Lasiodiplodia theobromae]
MATQTPNDTQPQTLHLVGIGVTHSIAPPMHNHIAHSLNLPWTFHSSECATIDDAAALGRAPTTAGLVVTMPYKQTIMPRLDGIDDLATIIGACNNVYRDPAGQLRGTNTDWLGVKGCLLEKGDGGAASEGAPALIVGAGGASRAALYALSVHLGCGTVYVLNRDEGEVRDLVRDAQRLASPPAVVHVTSLEQAKALDTPYYVVGTVPDFEPATESELLVKACLEEFLSRPEKGVLLDMCFKPRRTRMIKLAEGLGWFTVEGTHVIGYQIEEQWRLWAGEERVKRLNREGAWKVLLESADASPAINF